MYFKCSEGGFAGSEGPCYTWFSCYECATFRKDNVNFRCKGCMKIFNNDKEL